MPVPSYRVPVIIARGTLAALTSGLSDLKEGEICYAADEDALYVVEGGILTPAGSAATGDVVDDTTPQLGGPLDVNGNEIVSLANANVSVAPNGTGVLELRGNTGNDAAIQLNCEMNTHGVKIKSPPHSAAASYTLVLPENTGATGQALTTDGAGVLSWAAPSAVGSIDDLSDVDTTTGAPTTGQGLVWDGSQWVPGDVSDVDLGTSSIDDLSDVDTVTNTPTNDQVLAWNGTNWVPADQAGGGGGGVTSIIAGDGISVDQATGDVTITATGGGGGGAVDSVNGETGVVSLGVQDMDDVDVFPALVFRFATIGEASPGGWNGSHGYFQFNKTDSDGASAAVPNWPSVPATLWISTNGDAPVEFVNYSYVDGGSFVQLQYSTFEVPSGTFTIQGECLVYFADPASINLTEGDILQWNDADQKFKPGQLPVASVNGETGVVSLGVQDMDDYELATQLGTTTIPDKASSVNVGSPVTDWSIYAFDGSAIYCSRDLSILVDNLTAGAAISLTIPGEATHSTTISSVTLQTQSFAIILASGAPASYINAADGTPLTIVCSQIPGSTIPLAEGDTLQWSDADQKFNPAQIPDAIDKATFQSELAASADFADFQSRIAAL